MILIPAAATVPNMMMVAPPKTELGMMENSPPMIGKRPKTTSKPEIQKPTLRLATPVIWMTPLF